MKRYNIIATLTGLPVVPLYTVGMIHILFGAGNRGLLLMFTGVLFLVVYILTVITVLLFSSVSRSLKQALKKSILFIPLGIILGFLIVFIYSQLFS